MDARINIYLVLSLAALYILQFQMLSEMESLPLTSNLYISSHCKKLGHSEYNCVQMKSKGIMCNFVTFQNVVNQDLKKI